MNEGEEYEPIDHNTLLARFANVLYSMWLRPIAKSEDNDRLFFNTTLIEHFFRLFLEDENVQSLNSQDLGEIAKLNEFTGSANIENLASSQFEARIMHDANTDNFVFFHAPWYALQSIYLYLHLLLMNLRYVLGAFIAKQ